MSKIRVLSDHVANQIAAGEVVERPASVAKELVENSIDAGARRLEIDVEAGGRRLLRVADDGEGMTRDDAVLAFERHATSKITSAQDLERVSTLGFRGEALASIASVARVELVTQQEGGSEATRVLIEGGRMRDVAPAARPRGTTITVRDLFFNVPARRKFLRSEATETFHLTNLVTHYALAHPEIAFALTNNGRETLRAGAASDLRERAYQIFGAEFLENLLAVEGGREGVARVRGYVSAPRERRTTRDAQYLFVNGRFVRDKLVGRALSEGYRMVLPQGVYPAALLFIEVPPEEVDVNVHPAKTEVRFRRGDAVRDAVRDAIRAALSTGGYVRDAPAGDFDAATAESFDERELKDATRVEAGSAPSRHAGAVSHEGPASSASSSRDAQEAMDFGFTPVGDDVWLRGDARHVEQGSDDASHGDAKQDALSESGLSSNAGAPAARPPVASSNAGASAEVNPESSQLATSEEAARCAAVSSSNASGERVAPARDEGGASALPPLKSAAGIVRDVAADAVSPNIRPLGQLEDSFIVAADDEGMLLIDQHAAHERILFDKYHRLEHRRAPESQNLLVPQTFDLTPAQAAALDTVAPELESYGFSLMRLSGRTVAVRAVPADLPAEEARNMLTEALDAVDAERRGAARAGLRDRIAASLACRAAIKINTPLTPEKMRWLIERLVTTSSPTTCPHGRPSILRLTKRDIERGFNRP
ncbi:MAG TPA: DNA mismatch repair endonuclease MutL [Pyrinomonadaceae bacterium]|nr:DNA mismatch repair endonuclease MutL [Pyrinomonadaceae bacterium]